MSLGSIAAASPTRASARATVSSAAALSPASICSASTAAAPSRAALASTVRSAASCSSSPGCQPGAFELGDAEARELELLGAGALALASARRRALCAARSRAVRHAILLERRVERGVAVQELEMALGAEQRLMLVLAVNLHQPLAHPREASARWPSRR